jgi:hypothetical protein
VKAMEEIEAAMGDHSVVPMQLAIFGDAEPMREAMGRPPSRPTPAAQVACAAASPPGRSGTCNRPHGHRGDHRVYGRKAEVLASWDNS